MKIIDSIVNAVAGAKATKKNREAAENDRKQRMAMIESMDFEPMYASNTTPTFQRTQSPVARSYLESFLMGTNPNATFSGSPNAKAMQASQQRQENATFGTPQERAQRQQQILQETPWKVVAPTTPVKTEQSKESAWTAGNPEWVRLGYTQEDLQKLQAMATERGINPERFTNDASDFPTVALAAKWLGKKL